jgi:hypothetical protein
MIFIICRSGGRKTAATDMMRTLVALEIRARNQPLMHNLERLMLMEELVEECSRHLEHFR